MPRVGWLVVLAALGCQREFEGDEPGECSDGADNDRDRAFDCADPDCVGAPGCQDTEEPDDTDVPVDTEVEQDTDVPVDTDPEDTDVALGCGGWDGVGARPAGPHLRERGLVSAWQQLQATVDSSYGRGCGRVDDPDWADIFEPVAYEPDDYVYVFYQVQSGCTAAQGKRCGSRFPDDCVNSSVVYVQEAPHRWVGEQDPVTEPFDPLAAPGCSITQTTTTVVEDQGAAGVLTFEVSLSTTAACPAQVRENDGCVFTHTYDLDWVRAE